MSSQPEAIISMLRPLHNVTTDLPCARLAAQQLAHQLSARWPSMRMFAVSVAMHDLDGLGLEIVSQLVKGTWTDLETLRLCDCDLTAEGFLILSQGDWPCLMFLDISGNCLNAEGMALLAKGNWPLLTSLDLSFDPTMDAGAIAHLSAANWSLTNLTISDTPFSADMAAELADLQLPNLESLYLMESGLTAAAVSKLARADWPRLTYLNLSHADLDAVCVLLGLNLEKVQALKSSACDYSVEVQRTVPSDAWPQLQCIRVSKASVQLMCF